MAHFKCLEDSANYVGYENGLPLLVAGLEAYDVVGISQRTLVSEVIPGVCSDSSNGLEGFMDCVYHLGETLSMNHVNSLV